LDAFSDPETNTVSATSILQDFLASEKAADSEDKDSVFLPDLMQAWSFASETNDDKLLSAIPAVLALFLRTLSNILHLSDYGLRLARTVLLKKQQELLVRGLTSTKGKEFLISPPLRLLKEIVVFDGGVLAKQVFRSRDQTLKGLARNLSLRVANSTVENPKKPSVRTNALRFLLALIKFLPSESKRELLNQRDIASSITRDIKDDPSFIVCDILETLKTYVLLDETLPREAKTRVVNSTSLSRICALYRYEHAEGAAMLAVRPVDEVAHEFLILACTSPTAGVLLRQSGLYPRGIDPDDIHEVDTGDAFIDLGLDSIEWINKFKDKVPVRNTILTDFIQNLPPWSSGKQGELLLSILRAAPELYADYFYSKKDFSFSPKLTATWMGYAAFMFHALGIPLPAYFGCQAGYPRLPPPTAIVLENLLPLSLSQKVLTRCLTQRDHSLITFFAVRILCVALNKLKSVLQMYQEAAKGPSSIWSKAATHLVDDFCQRCPSIRDVIIAFRRMSTADLMQREAITKLLVLYYEVVPRIALDAKFGVSAALAETLQALEKATLTAQERSLCSIELEHLCEFAHYSPGMQWFAKTEGLSVSPLMAMLRLYVEAASDLPLLKLRSVLGSIFEESQILQTRTTISGLDSFILRLRNQAIHPHSSAIHIFLDDCISRCATKPVKYIMALEGLRQSAGVRNDSLPFSLLSLAILEQWPFLVKSTHAVTVEGVSRFVADYLAASVKIGEDEKTLLVIAQKLAEESSMNPPSQKIFKELKMVVADISVPEPETNSLLDMSTANSNPLSEENDTFELAGATADVKNPSEDHKSLTRWSTKDPDEVIEEGHAAALIMLLSSVHLSIRKEAVTNISKFAKKLKDSSVEEKEQIWLLLLELVETAKVIIDKEPLPTILSAFASSAIGVLRDPLHYMYGKINKFLSEGPTWRLDKIPLIHKIFNQQPILDDAHYSELHWMLSCLISGLRQPADMTLYRNRRVFENILSVYNSTNLAPGIREKILQIMFRANSIEGGSTALITRFSAMTWLQAQSALGGGIPLSVLMERIIQSCDQRRVKVWSKGAGRVNDDTRKFAGQV
jgi:nucleolar pre-ribosomal-associated protein 1